MKKAHIISHTHWDREWYLPYEKHHMLYIEMMDTLIETMEKDPNYKSFHLDGQTIMLEDYLQVRPENRQRLQNLIDAGRIMVGPWYVLQDEFLTSSEANVRNLQMGYQLAQEFGGRWTKVGYFPDSFGNMGQAPQILRKAGIDTAVFGRGVKPTGFNNQTTEAYESTYSEMNWESGDGSSVLGILFANWYNNGAEIPLDKEEAQVYWDKKLADAKRYASTNQMLFLNGCDHQPVQTDLSEAIEKANELYPDVEFVHSNFPEYIEELKKELPENLNVITGELRSQRTDGWYTLANTASSRIYLKQMNTHCQMLLEKMAEPLATMASKEGMEYPYHLFQYGWKLLMQNHPHDSICCCSVDDVHREMVTRFEKAKQVALHIIDSSMEYLNSNMDTSKLENQGIPFLVVNTSGWERTGVVEAELQTERMYFREAPVKEVVQRMHESKSVQYQVMTKDGKCMDATITELPNSFDYDLPKDKFRQPYIAKRVKITFEASQIPAYGWDTYVLKEVKETPESAESLVTGELQMENKYLKIRFEEDGSFELTNKENGRIFSNQGIFEDCGDIGNEYIFFQPVMDKAITTQGTKARLEVIENTSVRATMRVTHTLMLPKEADERLAQEIQDLVEFKDRKAARGKELVAFEIVTEYSLEREGRGCKARTTFNNQILDHRLRVLFETNLVTDYHYADSVFEVAKRNNIPSVEWENPCNAQPQQSFVNVQGEEGGLTIANKGLPEYEILRDGHNTIALTLHRGVREMGDWGVFLTPEAQCLGMQTVEYELIPHTKGKDCYRSYIEAYQYQVDWLVTKLEVQTGTIPMYDQFVNKKHVEVMPTSLKRSWMTHNVVMRFCNLAEAPANLTIDQDNLEYLDLLEKQELGSAEKQMALGKKEICTIGWKENR